MSTLVSTIGCVLVLAGFAAERYAEHRWLAAGRPAPLDALAIFGLLLPFAGLALLASPHV
jgi:hypothetical protein